MQFVEMTGKTLARIVNEGELREADMVAAGISEETIVRVNAQGDIEVRGRDGWDVVGGLLGDYEDRVRRISGLNWV